MKKNGNTSKNAKFKIDYKPGSNEHAINKIMDSITESIKGN